MVRSFIMPWPSPPSDTRAMTETAQPPPVSPSSERRAGIRGWLDERLGLSALYRKYGRKAFPVHASFFLGEMALFAFIILVLTGIYLGFIYVPSNVEITVAGETLPEAYASVRLIESIPVASLFRNTHHWAAHLMVAAVLLHMVRVFFTGTYRKPRELNWIVGIILLGLTLMAGFVGYALPYDSYAVTATGTPSPARSPGPAPSPPSCSSAGPSRRWAASLASTRFISSSSRLCWPRSLGCIC
jgi:hypothetical protein